MSSPTDFEDKVGNCIAAAKNLQAGVDAYDDEIKRLQGERQTKVNSRVSLLGYVQMQMESIGRFKIEAGLHKASIVKNPPRYVIKALHQIPKMFIKTITDEHPDKKAILVHFKETGEIIDGADIQQGSHLRISESIRPLCCAPRVGRNGRNGGFNARFTR